jgi:hypothetical protein
MAIIPWHLPYNWGKSKEKPQFYGYYTLAFALQLRKKQEKASVLWLLYPGICLTTEKKARKNLSYGYYTLAFALQLRKKQGKTSVLWLLYPGICLTTEEKARKNLSPRAIIINFLQSTILQSTIQCGLKRHLTFDAEQQQGRIKSHRHPVCEKSKIKKR